MTLLILVNDILRRGGSLGERKASGEVNLTYRFAGLACLQIETVLRGSEVLQEHATCTTQT